MHLCYFCKKNLKHDLSQCDPECIACGYNFDDPHEPYETEESF